MAPYWVWDPNNKDYYHAEKAQNGESCDRAAPCMIASRHRKLKQREGTWRYTWASSLRPTGAPPASNVPRASLVPQSSGSLSQARPACTIPAPQPRDPARASDAGWTAPRESTPCTNSYDPNSPLSTAGALPGAVTSQPPSTLGASITPTYSYAPKSHASQQQPCLPQQQFPFTATSNPTALPGTQAARVPSGQTKFFDPRESSKLYTYSSSPVTGYVPPVHQAPTSRSTGTATSGPDKPSHPAGRDKRPPQGNRRSSIAEKPKLGMKVTGSKDCVGVPLNTVRHKTRNHIPR